MSCFVGVPYRSMDRERILTMSAVELGRALRAGALQSRAIVEAHVARIRAVNPTINAVVKDRFDQALREADAADAARAETHPDDLPVFHGVPFTEIAQGLGKSMVKNIVALGALSAATGLFPKETFLAAIRQALKEKSALIPLNEKAFDLGAEAVAGVCTPGGVRS